MYSNESCRNHGANSSIADAVIFQSLERRQATLQAVETTTLPEDFQQKGFRHNGDVAWRNVRIYYDEFGQFLKAVVFDMQRVVESHQNESWVEPADYLFLKNYNN